MKVFDRIKFFYKTHFNQRPTSDDNFNSLLRIFYILGFFNESNSMPRIIFSALKFAGIFLIQLLGCVINFLLSLDDTATSFNITPLILLLRFTVFTSEFVSIVVQKTEICALVKDLSPQNIEDEKTNRLCSRLIKLFTGVFSLVVISLVIVNTILSDQIHCVMPAIYNGLGNIFVIFSINLIHYIIILRLLLAVDLVPIVSILKLHAIIITLCSKVKQVTSGSNEENEKSLDECIKMHIDVIG